MTSTHHSLAIVSSKAPYGTYDGQEALDMVLAAGAFGQQVGLFFIDDGVFQLLKSQQPEAIELKNYSKTFAALPFYDIEQIFVCANSLQKREIEPPQLCIEVTMLDSKAFSTKLSEYQHIIKF